MRKLYVSLFLSLVVSAQAFAQAALEHGSEMVMPDEHMPEGLPSASVAVESAANHGHHKTAGLPQLDPTSFMSQTFWLLIVVGVLYVFFSQKSLPDIANVIDSRAKKIQDDLNAAQKIRDEVAGVQKSYEDGIAKARAQAGETFKTMESDLKLKSDAQVKTFQEKASAQIAGVEKSVSLSKERLMDEMNTLAADLAQEAVFKIIGIKPDSAAVGKVIGSLQETQQKSRAA